MSSNLKYASDNIKLLLKYKNWTQEDLCKKTGITHTTLRRRLNNKIPKWTMLEAVSVSRAFGLSVSDIFFTHMIPKGNNDKNEQVS